MRQHLNNVRVNTATTGTGTVTLSTKFSNKYMNETEAGAVDATTYRIKIEDGNDWEFVEGVYTASGRTFTRVTVLAASAAGTVSTSKLNLSGSATVRFVGLADDLDKTIRVDEAQTYTASLLAQAMYNVGWQTAVSVASATTTNIGAAASNYINITSTTTITAFDTVTAGLPRLVKFAGALTLTHNGTNLILPGAANITTAAGDTALFMSEGSGNWRCHHYQPASGKPVIPTTTGAGASEVRVGTDTAKYVTAKSLADAAAVITLSDAATIAWDMSTGFNAKVTLGASRTMGTPTNPIEGWSYTLAVIQGVGSSTVTWPAGFEFGADGAPTLQTTISKRDMILLYCYDASTPKFTASFKKGS